MSATPTSGLLAGKVVLVKRLVREGMVAVKR